MWTGPVSKIVLDIANGALLVPVGPSGCRETTLLHMIGCLEAIAGGTTSIGGRAVNDLEPSERGVAMVFRNYAPYPHIAGEEGQAGSPGP